MAVSNSRKAKFASPAPSVLPAYSGSAGKKTKKIDVVCDARLDKYFAITEKALKMVKESPKDESRAKEAAEFLEMAECYLSDAKHFRSQGNYVLAFAAVNYAHAWLDAGARIKLFKVNDNQLFAAD